jgi:signal transduction histidine kinase
VQKCQQNIEKASTRIQRLSDHLREYTRSEKEAFAPILCSELLEDCLLMLETRAHMVGAHIHRHIQPVNLIFQARRNQLEQVLINLIANACDALKDQPIKTIYISAQEIHHKEGSQVYISIKDTGAGIKEEDLERIFEAFYTTKPKGQGTGLGLSTAEGIIKEHQGHLEVKSECGKGTEFIVKLPMQQTP